MNVIVKVSITMTPGEFEKLYDENAQALFRYCYFRVFDRERAKDLMQDAFTKTWEYAAKGNEIDSPKAFLYRVAHNLAINDIRKSGRTTSLETMNEETGFDPSSEDHERVTVEAEVREMLDKVKELKEEDVQVLTLRYVADMAIKEIAKSLGESENAISVRIHRATERLKKVYTT
jgi:RNA polymerase sigma-70 factor (ECF subfamily)